MHLLYAREFTKMMRDIGLVQQDEPFTRAVQPGPDPGPRRRADVEVAGQTSGPRRARRRYGADTVRLFLMFMGPWDQGGPWSPTGIGGVHRFLNRVWTLVLDAHGREPGDPDAGALPAGETEADAQAAIRAAAHRTLRDVTADYEAFHFNTMIAKLMELSNTLFRYRGTSVAGIAGLGRGDPPAAADAGAGGAAHHRGAVEPAPGRRRASRGSRSTPRRGRRSTRPRSSRSTREIPVQVNGKLRDKVVVAADASQADIEAAVLARDKIQAILDGRTPERVVVAGGGRLVNLVVR